MNTPLPVSTDTYAHAIAIFRRALSRPEGLNIACPSATRAREWRKELYKIRLHYLAEGEDGKLIVLLADLEFICRDDHLIVRRKTSPLGAALAATLEKEASNAT